MTHSGPVDEKGTRLLLDIWHPDCWTLQVTERTDGGLFGHGVYPVEEKVKGRFTAYADSDAALDELVSSVEASPLTDGVWQMDRRYDIGTETATPGNATRSLLVEYGEDRSIAQALVSRGFIPDKPVWIHDGREYWVVVVDQGRAEMSDNLDAVRSEMDAEIDVRTITSDDQSTGGLFRMDILSERQREVFQLAWEAGYYNWPRDVSATDLAEELEITKTTFLEHLRKAEGKLFDAMF